MARPKTWCTIDGCDKRNNARGYCHRHYRQWRLTGDAATPLRPQRPVGAVLERDAEGRKLCIGCRQWLAEVHFSPGGGASDRLNPRCKHCTLIAKYNLTHERYAEILQAQGGRCAICRTDEPNGKGCWHIDHDHSCCPGYGSCGECVRGLLCFSCNAALGSLKDNPQRLLTALSYLTKYSRKEIHWPAPMTPLRSALLTQ